MKFYGLIHAVDLNTKVISIKKFNKLYFFYFQNSLMHLFKRYLYPGVIIDLDYNPDDMIHRGYCEAYIIKEVNELYAPSRYGKQVFYNKTTIHKSLKQVLNSLNMMLFLDLEMTMPDYRHRGRFKGEIIQAGFYLVDSNFEEVLKKVMYIKPLKNPFLSDRTLDFLKITQEAFDGKAISYTEFYNEFENMLLEYEPSIIVYGKNDILALDHSYYLHKKTSLKPYCRFINLNSLVKQFYALRSDPGLFRLYEYYYKIDSKQKHDALDDAYVTFKVFKAFVENIQYGNKLSEDF